MGDKKAYQQVFKATSLFGGVQVLQIIISAIKSKAAALFLGPVGMGVYRVLHSSVVLIEKITNFGLPLSIVKFISKEITHNNHQKAIRLIRIFKKLVWISAILGALILMALSSWLSEMFFDTKSYTFSFVLVSSAVLFHQLFNGTFAILRGMRKLKHLAKASLYGNIASLIVVVPLYYFFRDNAIVPAIIITAFFNLLSGWFFIKQHKIPKLKLTYKESISDGKELLTLGIVLSLTGFLTTFILYLVQIFIDHRGGVAQVGLFSAGMMVLNTYGSLVFRAMGQDYFPRLSGIIDDYKLMLSTVKQQAFVALFVITPIVILFLGLAPQLIILLFSSKFIGIKLMISWGILGLILKSVSWPLGYVIIAKGDTKVYFMTILIFSVIELGFLSYGYALAGLTGLGAAFLAYHLIFLIGLYLINFLIYKFRFSFRFFLQFFICITLGSLALFFSFIEYPLLKYALFVGLLFLSSWYSYTQLNKKIDFKELIKTFQHKKSGK